MRATSILKEKVEGPCVSATQHRYYILTMYTLSERHSTRSMICPHVHTVCVNMQQKHKTNIQGLCDCVEPK